MGTKNVGTGSARSHLWPQRLRCGDTTIVAGRSSQCFYGVKCGQRKSRWDNIDVIHVEQRRAAVATRG
jgi:hypothetical protein